MGITDQLRTLAATAAHSVRWDLRSLEGSRRNAMTASTVLTQRRIELDEVEEFLVRHRRRYDARLAHAAPARPA